MDSAAARPPMLTVGQLKEILRDVPDDKFVVLVVPPAFRVEPELTLFYNVRISYEGGHVLKVRPIVPEEEAVE